MLTIDSSFKASFDALLKLQEVILHTEVITVLADIWIEVPSSEEQARVCRGTAQQVVL